MIQKGLRVDTLRAPAAGTPAAPHRQGTPNPGRNRRRGRAVVARKGILATTVADIAAEAGRSTASFYNYYESKEAMVREWAMRFQDEAGQRARTVTEHGLTDRERVTEAVAAHWNTYRNRLAEMISVSQLATVNADFAQYWAELCAVPLSFITGMVMRAQAQGHCPGDDPHLIAEALVAMFNQFCYIHLSGSRTDVDDEACIQTLTNIVYRTIYSEEP